MMPNDEERIDRVERVLTEAYRARGEGLPHPDVTARVMREIRGSRPAQAWAAVMPDDLVWRTASIAAAVVLVVALLTVQLVHSGLGENAPWPEEFETSALIVE
ncbi:MAG TPA: hypothetical protein VFS39_17970 [Nitrospira sp.]|nr:hypothetical protein [Nitrospira sp.]